MSADTVWLAAYRAEGCGWLLDAHGPEVDADPGYAIARAGHTAPGLYRVTWPAWDGWGDEPAPTVERVGDLPTLAAPTTEDVARRARAWGRAEGLAEAQQAARARSRDWGAMTMMAVVLRSIARDLDPRDRVAHPDAPEEAHNGR